jgi:hypothetical protein
MLNIGGELRHVGQVATLACRPRIHGMCQGPYQGFLVHQDGVGPAFKDVPKMPDSFHAGEKLMIEGGSLHLGLVQLLGEDPQRLPC